MEVQDPAREKAAPLIDVVRGPLAESVKALERRSHELPTGQDFHFYSNFQEFTRPVAAVQSRVVSLLSQLGSLKDVVAHASPFPPDADDEGYDWLVGVQDALLERVDASLDKFYVARKAESKQKPEVNTFEAASKKSLAMQSPRSAAGSASEGSKSGDVQVAKNKHKSATRSPIPFHIPSIPRPQDRFDDAVDNSNTPFRHKALKKRIEMESPVSIAQGSRKDMSAGSNLSVLEQHARKLGHNDPADQTHPLEEELTKLAYVEGLLDTVEIRKYRSLDDTPLNLVTKLKDLKKMAIKLRKAGEIAVDLEHHHYRSYQGFVCLMQVSTRDEDFIVDTLDLRSQIGPCLRDIFADPTIRKVMHGADRDIIWLQRDFGIYVCNLFDTGQAARVLQLQGFGLAFLLEHFCQVHADKRYQLADWRIRPLPVEMIKYAREDTHYLLYVHDMLKQLLLNARADQKAEGDDPTTQVYKRSRDICLQLYAKEIFTETSYQQFYGLQEKNFRPEQLAVLAALYAWRDSVARKEDESTGFVLPNHLLLQLASEMPGDTRKLQSFVKGSHSFVSRHASAVIEVIRQSKEKALMELQESHQGPEGRERKAKPPRENIASDEISNQVSNITHCRQIKETVLEVDKEEVMETLQTEKLVKEMETSTVVGLPGLDTLASETTGRDEAGHSLTPSALGDGQSKLASDVSAGPVIVSRKTTSSFFVRKSGRTSSVPLSSSNVPVLPKERDGTSVAQDSRTPMSTGLVFPPDSSLQNVDQALPDACTDEHDNSTTLGKEQGQDRAHERTLAKVAVTSVEIQAAGAVSSSTVEAVERARDEPSTVPEIGPLQVSKRKGKSPQMEVRATSGDKSGIPASLVNEKVSENAPITQAKRKPSKLGSLLGGRKRVRQTGASEIAQGLEQQARMKTQEIESSMVLPFGPPVGSLAVISGTDEQPPFAGEVRAIALPDENLDNGNGNLHEETGRPVAEESSERPASGTATELPDVFMFEIEAAEDLEESRKHRMWWPDKRDNQRKRNSKSPRPGPQDTDRGQPFDRSAGDRNPDIPMSLSEMHPHRGKKGRTQSEASFNSRDPEVPAGGFDARASGSRNKKKRKERPLLTEAGTEAKRIASADSRVDVASFNYREARDALGVDNLFTEKAGDRQGAGGRGRGRGRGSKKDNSRSSIPLSRTAFDPLRRTREEPRPEGIKPGQRRQVFPQSGNRTAVFKQ